MQEKKYHIDSLFDDIESSLDSCPADHVRRRLVKLQRALDERDGSLAGSASEAQAKLVAGAQSLMVQNAGTPLTIDEMARALGVSPTLLKQTFRSVVGVPIYKWYRAHRIERARDLLEHSSLTVAEIAKTVGYANPSKFSKAFCDETGHTPRDWRKQMTKGS